MSLKLLSEMVSPLFDQSTIYFISGLVVIFFIIGLLLHTSTKMYEHGKLLVALSVLWTAFVPVVMTLPFFLGAGLIFLAISYISKVLAIILVPLFIFAIVYTLYGLMILPEFLIKKKNRQSPTPKGAGVMSAVIKNPNN